MTKEIEPINELNYKISLSTETWGLMLSLKVRNAELLWAAESNEW